VAVAVTLGTRRPVVVYAGLALTLAAVAASAALMVVSPAGQTELRDISRMNDAGTLLAAVAFAAVGTLILLRTSGNRVGWLFWVMGPVVALNILAGWYAVHALLDGTRSLPGGATAAWLQSWTSGVPVTLALSLLFLIFPDGKLQGRRWRLAVWAASTGFVLVAVGSVLWWKNTTEAFSAFDNPYGV
jgi:hypothetical protein